MDGSPPCSYPFVFTIAAGQSIHLEAIPETDYHFAYWSGDLTGDENPVDFTAFVPKSITAHFLTETGDFSSEDGTIHVTISDGTTIQDEEGNPLSSLEFIVDEIPPPLPARTNIVGLPYILGPSGATFDQPATLTWSYKPANIPSGIAEEDLFLAYYDESAGEWVELSSVVDLANDTITASIEHLTTFAIIASSPLEPADFTISSLNITPLKLDVNESVSISALVTNTGEEEGSYTVSLKVDDMLEETKEVTLDGGTSKMVTFTTARGEVGTYSVDVNDLTASFTVKEATIKWIVLGPVIAGVLSLIVYLTVNFRRRGASSYWES